MVIQSLIRILVMGITVGMTSGSLDPKIVGMTDEYPYNESLNSGTLDPRHISLPHSIVMAI